MSYKIGSKVEFPMLVNVFSVNVTEGQTSPKVPNDLAYFQMHKMNPTQMFSHSFP
jgi:hypothetical protein